MGIGSIVPRVNASYLMSCCAIVWSMFLSNVKYKLHSYWPENTALLLLIKVQLNALGFIRLAIMLRDWLAFFRRRRRQVSHLLFSKPILKKKIKKQQNQSALSHYLQFCHLTVFELDSFIYLYFFEIFLCVFFPKIWPCIQKRLTAHYFGYTGRQHLNHFVKSQPLWLCYVSDDINIGRHSGNIVAF